MARRAAIAQGTLGAAAALLSACSRAPAPAAGRAARIETEIDELRYDDARVVVAGVPLDIALLRRFYARRDFEPVWTERQAQADQVVAAVLKAGEHGMQPEQFYASLLHRRMSFPPDRRDMLITQAALSYAEALAKGVVSLRHRNDGEALAPEPVDVVAVLHRALGGGNPAGAIEALAPATPTYRALREALHQTGRRGPAARRLREIKVNLERQRWLPRTLPADRVWVNVADQALTLYREDKAAFSTRVIVGEASEPNQSPEFHTTIEASWFNPPWIVPRDIVEAEYLPRIERDPDYLRRNNMVLRDNGEIEQMPGPTAGLGAIMFDMPNRFDVYLHDTPGRALFRRDNRRISHGCIRVQNPIDFAALLMRQPVEAIRERIARSGTVRVALPVPTPVFIVYQTAFADSAGRLQFRPDFYNRDPALWQHLNGGTQL